MLRLLLSIQTCKKLLSMNPVATENLGKEPAESGNVLPNNQLHTERCGGHCTSFLAMLCSLHSITDLKTSLE